MGRALLLTAFWLVAGAAFAPWAPVSPAFAAPRSGGPAPGERAPAVADKFYPGDAASLRLAVEAYLAHAIPARAETPIAIVVPHAGYVFSGQIAADGYAQMKGRRCNLVVILGTNHTAADFHGISVYTGPGYRTPLGLAEVDRAAATALAGADRAFAYRAAADEREHSVEVQVPFVQVAFPGAKILPAVVGTDDPQTLDRFARALARVLAGKQALIVASSDLSHYPSYDDAVAADAATLAGIASCDPAVFRAAIAREMNLDLPGLVTCACGEAPILAAMAAARVLGATHGVVLSAANSGDTALGDPDRVVGYGAVAFYTGAGAPDASVSDARKGTGAAPAGAAAAAGRDSLTAADRDALLALARETIHQYLTSGTVPLARATSPALSRRQGAFVTVKKNGELRGCIGHMAEDRPLAQVVSAMAMQAAFSDPRFSPLELEEYPEITIEISVLTPFARVPGPEAIVVGRDGVLLKKDGRSAVFLPQVAPEQGWSRDEMLNHLAQKAGLPSSAWRKGAEFYTFRADVFAEREPAASRAAPGAGGTPPRR